MQSKFLRKGQWSSVRASSPAETPKAPPRPLSFLESVIAGAAAGGTELLAMYPLDTVKTRQQLVSASDAAAGQSPSLVGTLRGIVEKEGAAALYRGILSPLAVEPFKRAVKFSANARYNALIVGDGKKTVLTSTLCGALAGMSEVLIIAPFEVVKVRMQSKERKAVYKDTFDALRKILQQEGPIAFTQGIESALWRQAIWNGTYFGVIFWLKESVLWRPRDDSALSVLGRNFTAGVLAGTCATALNTPFDVVVSRMRNVLPGEKTPYRWAWQSLALIAREEGPRALWKGFGAKVARLGPGGGIMLVVFELVSNWLRSFDKT